MKLEYNEEQLMQLMKDFHTLTGMKIVLFDGEYRELLAWPGGECAFCRKMKANPYTKKLCAESDETSFLQCKATGRMIIYPCHAGLIEAAAPLIDHHTVIGYLMFGQISNEPDHGSLLQKIGRNLEGFRAEGCSGDGSGHTKMAATVCDVSDIPLKTDEQIRAAAKIMEACVLYVLFDKSIALRQQNFADNLRNFLMDHLREDLTADSIAKQLYISRSRLYQVCDRYLGMGIAEYVRMLRMDEAMRLLKETDLPVTEVADMTGFSDYNYFCRVFKKHTGLGAKKYRDAFRGK